MGNKKQYSFSIRIFSLFLGCGGRNERESDATWSMLWVTERKAVPSDVGRREGRGGFCGKVRVGRRCKFSYLPLPPLFHPSLQLLGGERDGRKGELSLSISPNRKRSVFFRVGEMSRCVVFPSPCFMGKWGAECENPSSPVLLIFKSLSYGKDRDSMKKLIPLKKYSGNVAFPLFLNPVWKFFYRGNPTPFFS